MIEEQGVLKNFKCNTVDHQMQIIEDDGVNRHLRFAAPNTYIYGYDLVTWPGFLVITGDCGCFVFSRIHDMFEFFGDDQQCVDLRYWSEKLQAPKHYQVRKYSYEKFISHVYEWARHACRKLGKTEATKLRHDVFEYIVENDDCRISEYAAMQIASEFESSGIVIEDFYEWDVTEFDYQYLWCCHAIVAGIKKYREEINEA